MSQEVLNIPLTSIRENEVALRGVDRESEEYLGLRDSINKIGLTNSVSVRRRTDDVEGVKVEYYELCDGLQRYSACVDLGLKDIPVIIHSLGDSEVLEAQIMANVHKIETKPVEYTRQLQRLFAMNPTWTLADMAARLAKSASWVQQRLGLLKLEKSVATLVDDGKITVANAVALSKLPHDEQLNHIDQAMTMRTDEFAPTVQARAKELRDAAREGRKAEPVTFAPIAHLRKLGELKDELEKKEVGPALCKQAGVKTVAEAFALGVAYAISLDPISVEAQKAANDAKRQRLDDAKKKRAAERAKKKAEDAATAAAKAADEARGVN